jgi:superfamily I DNA/RNA helicase
VTALGEEHAHGRAWSEMAILHRNRWDGGRIARELEACGIPCCQATGHGKQVLFARGDQVKLVTMHSSKGLEFPFVAIPDLGALPAPGRNPAEEARLLYVAMTRATEQLLLLYHADSIFTRRIRASIHAVQAELASAIPADAATACGGGSRAQ